MMAFCVALTGVAVSQQGEETTLPFTIEITDNLEAGHSNQWDFANSGETTVKAGSMVVVRVRKTSRSDHEIARVAANGSPYGYEYEVHNSNGQLLERKTLKNSRGWILDGGPGIVRGSKDMVLQPGETQTATAIISDWFDLSQPGTYSIQLLQHVSSLPQSPVVKSNTIEIRVVSAD